MFKHLVTQHFAAAGITIGGRSPWDMRLTPGREGRFYRRVALLHSLGLGRAYMDGDFECDDLVEMLARMINASLKRKQAKLRKSPRWKWVFTLPHTLPDAMIWLKLKTTNQQDIVRAQRVAHHYNVGNTLYRIMLGASMAYSCGYWPGAHNLDDAQFAKYRHICKKSGLKAGMRVLEIGGGWGGLAAYAIENFGVEVVMVTISKEQHDYVREKYAKLIEAGKLTVLLEDYRKIPERYPDEHFDRIFSVGMFEHVGPDNYEEYMRIAWLVLKRGGKFLLHTIVGSGHGPDPFLWYYIFPGGVLPTEGQITEAARTYFVIEHMENFGYDYYKTTIAWRENFRAGWQQLLESGKYDERFRRMWEHYLASCAAVFRERRVQLQQWMLSKGGEPGGFQWGRMTYAS
ncbi:MAG: class I SAM-dependent methyltransferase [Candidatus Kaiserbacteria bacterium]|nr:class I SAM-dependent methyltransferase [Candidatus Kaiserbacteria bacterium]